MPPDRIGHRCQARANMPAWAREFILAISSPQPRVMQDRDLTVLGFLAYLNRSIAGLQQVVSCYGDSVPIREQHEDQRLVRRASQYLTRVSDIWSHHFCNLALALRDYRWIRECTVVVRGGQAAAVAAAELLDRQAASLSAYLDRHSVCRGRTRRHWTPDTVMGLSRLRAVREHWDAWDQTLSVRRERRKFSNVLRFVFETLLSRYRLRAPRLIQV